MAGAEKNTVMIDCFFCTCKGKEYSSKTRKNNGYPNFPSELCPVPRGPNVPLPSPPKYLDNVQLSSGSDISNDESNFCCGDKNNEP